MAKPKDAGITLKETLSRLKKAGLSPIPAQTVLETEDALQPLPDRISKILNIVRLQPKKAVNMNYLIMYDIEDNKVRRHIAKYLEKNGCLRIQKSVFMANTTHKHFCEIFETLKDVNDVYENSDSIILVPVNVADVRSMKLIGSNVSIDVLTDPPNTLFF